MNRLFPPLSYEGLQLVHSYTLRILEEIGVSFYHPKALEILKSHGACVEESRVFFPPALVEEALKCIPRSFQLLGGHPQYDVEIGGDLPVCASVAGALYMGNPNGTHREVERKDYRDLVKLIQNSPVLSVNPLSSLYPKGMSKDDFLPFSLFSTLTLSKKPFLGFTGGREAARACIDVANIISGSRIGNHLLGIASVSTPLIYDQGTLEGMFEYIKEGEPLCIASCGMAGSTAPVSLMGALALTNAEILAGILFAQLQNPGLPVIYGNTSAVTDMRTMHLSIGAAETALLNAGAGQLSHYYGIPFRSGGGLTDSKVVDSRAGYEAMMNLMISFFTGVDFILQAGGVLDSFLVASFEKLVIDEEIISLLHRYLKGFDVMYLNQSFEELKERGPGAHFLDSETTISAFKSELKQPLFQKLPAFDEAQEICKRRLLEYRRPLLEDGVLKELELYCRDAFAGRFLELLLDPDETTSQELLLDL